MGNSDIIHVYDDEEIKLSSAKSMEISLERVRQRKAGLSKHRESLLSRVPSSNDWASFPKGSVSMKDIAFLTAKTGDEFAILEGKKEDILFHGVRNHCVFDAGLGEMLMKGRLRIYGHSHPGERFPMPSYNDRDTLKRIGQKKSRLVSAVTGREIEFTDNAFESLKNEQYEEGSGFGYVDS